MKKRRTRDSIFRELPLYIMMLPAIILVAIYSYAPMLGIIMAFQNFKLSSGFLHSEFIGLENFRRLFTMPNIWEVIRNTVLISFSKMVGGIIVPVTFALLLNEVRHVFLKRSLQTLVYLPNFISWVILAGVFRDILSPSSGIVNQFLGFFGMQPIFFLGDRFWFPATMVITDIWKGFGFGSVIYLGALTGIDPALYESAEMDGANRWKQTIHITLPCITSIVILMTVLSMGNILNGGFDQIFNLINPSVMATGDILDTMVYRLGIDGMQYSLATAAGLFKSIVSLGFVLLSYFLADKFAGYRIF